MPRTARASVGGICYHVINRGNARATVYHDPADYRAFIDLMKVACQRIPMRVLTYCLMPNHFHLVIWPRKDGHLSRWMHWLLTAHVSRHQRVHSTTGRIWQGRFKAFAIEQDRHLLTVMRYVERNPVRANLVQDAAAWDWSSLSSGNISLNSSLLSVSPVTKPRNWREFVNEPQTADEVAALRHCGWKNTPYGSKAWVTKTVVRLGLQSSVRGPGRPKPGHS
ncbi:MAG: transposase [Gammaproteobacteria bacterium]|nr:transposase [Gammaproteobacteria bacterium]